MSNPVLHVATVQHGIEGKELSLAFGYDKDGASVSVHPATDTVTAPIAIYRLDGMKVLEAVHDFDSFKQWLSDKNNIDSIVASVTESLIGEGHL